MPRLTLQAFADHVGTTRQGVQKLTKAGILDLSKGIDESRLVYIARLREQAAGRAGLDDADYDLTTERARLAHHQANKTELEEQVLRGELVPQLQVLQMLETVIANARAKLLTLPVKAAQIAISAGDIQEIESEIQNLVYESLNELTNASSGNSTGGASDMGAAAPLNS